MTTTKKWMKRLHALISSVAAIGCSPALQSGEVSPASPTVSDEAPARWMGTQDVLAEVDSDLHLKPNVLLAQAASGSGADALLRRAAALAASGAYEQAMRTAESSTVQLSAEQDRWLQPRLGIWELLRYTDTEGYFLYDEDLRMREPGALLAPGPGHAKSVERDAIYSAGSMLSMAGLISSLPKTQQLLLNTADSLVKQLCPSSETACARGVQRAFPIGRIADFAHAKEQLSSARREAERNGDALTVGALWMMLGDAEAAPNSTPLQLNLLPFMSTTALQQRSGTAAPEFAQIAPAAAERACVGYRNAAAAWHGHECTRCTAHLAFRQSYLAARQSAECVLDGSASGTPFQGAAELFHGAGDRRRALQARAAQLALARESGSLAAPEIRTQLLTLAADSDPGPVMGAARVLNRYAWLLWSLRGRLDEAWQLYGDAISLAKTAKAEFLATSIAADQGELAKRLGRLAEANELRMGHLASLEKYRAALPAVVPLAAQLPSVLSSICLVEFEIGFGVRANLLQLGALSVPEWGESKRIAERGLECANNLDASAKEALRRAFDVQDINADWYERKFDAALAKARKLKDVSLEAGTLCMQQRAPRALRLMREPIARALRQARTLKGESAAEQLLLQGTRSTLEYLVLVLVRASAFAEGQRLLDQADEARGQPWLFASSETPWERPHVMAELAAGTGDSDRAASHYEEAFARIESPSMGANARGLFDDETANVRNDYIAFLARSGRVGDALALFERTRRRSDRDARSDYASIPALDVPALIYHSWDETSGVFLLQPGVEPEYFPLPVRPSQLNDTLRQFLSVVAEQGKPRGKHDWSQSAQSVYEILFETVDKRLAWKAARTVLIIPHGAMQELPFQALVDRAGKPLVTRFNFVYATDLHAYDSASRRARTMLSDSGRLEVDALAFNGTVLAHAEQAAQELATRPGKFGASATSAALFELLKIPGVLHVGAHALQDWLHPSRSSLSLASGPLHIGDLEGVSASRRAVVLSACDTANGGLRAGENRASWPPALLRVGVPTVVASNWKIEDGIAREGITWTSEVLIGSAYEHMRKGEPIAVALASAQREFAALRDFRAHPHYWAAFSTYGAGL